MSKFCSLLFLVLLVISCETEPVEVPFTKQQFTRLLSGEQSKEWEVLSNGEADFEKCTDGVTYAFRKSDQISGQLYILAPNEDCGSETLFERDTIKTYDWNLTQSESLIFDEKLFLKDGDELMTLLILDITPLDLSLRSESENVVIRLIEF